MKPGTPQAAYEDSEHPGCWRVPLGGKAAARAGGMDSGGMAVLIDAADLGLVQGGRCTLGGAVQGGSAGFVAFSRPGHKSTPLRRVLVGATQRGQQVGHKNGDPLDCRRANLVVRSYSERNRGRTKAKTNDGKATTSRFRGVYFESFSKRYRASIRVDGKTLRLGRYRDEAEAARAYDAAARAHFGKDTPVNFPGEGEVGVAVNEGAVLPAGMSVAPTEAERAAAQAAEEAALRAAGWMMQEEVVPLFEVSLSVWKRWKKAGKVGKGKRPYVPGPVWYERSEVERWFEALGPIGEPYADPERAGCWRVPLTTWACRRDKNRREVLIDAASLTIVRGKRWGWNRDAVGDGGHVVLSESGNAVPLARRVLGLRDSKRRVIYLNHDPLDCRRANLKAASRSLSQQRGKKMGSLNGRKYTSRFKGVCFHKNSGMWIAQLKKNRVNRFHGYFKTEVEAAKAYDRAAWELYGPEAFLNFPPPEVGFGQVRGADTGEDTARRAA